MAARRVPVRRAYENLAYLMGRNRHALFWRPCEHQRHGYGDDRCGYAGARLAMPQDTGFRVGDQHILARSAESRLLPLAFVFISGRAGAGKLRQRTVVFIGIIGADHNRLMPAGDRTEGTLIADCVRPILRFNKPGLPRLITLDPGVEATAVNHIAAQSQSPIAVAYAAV